MNYTDPSFDAFYAQGVEELRLILGLGSLEFLKIQDSISRYSPSSNGVTAGIGRGQVIIPIVANLGLHSF